MAFLTGVLIVLALMVLIFLGPEWGAAIYRWSSPKSESQRKR